MKKLKKKILKLISILPPNEIKEFKDIIKSTDDEEYLKTVFKNLPGTDGDLTRLTRSMSVMTSYYRNLNKGKKADELFLKPLAKEFKKVFKPWLESDALKNAIKDGLYVDNKYKPDILALSLYSTMASLVSELGIGVKNLGIETELKYEDTRVKVEGNNNITILTNKISGGVGIFESIDSGTKYGVLKVGDIRSIIASVITKHSLNAMQLQALQGHLANVAGFALFTVVDSSEMSDEELSELSMTGFFKPILGVCEDCSMEEFRYGLIVINSKDVLFKLAEEKWVEKISKKVNKWKKKYIETEEETSEEVSEED